MALPNHIEILPLRAPVQAQITLPGSKSITNRALVLAALANGVVTLKGALWSEDTQVMVAALQKLGFDVQVDLDPGESCNRTIQVRGRSGQIPNAGTAREPLEIFVGNAGTAARFLAAMLCLGRGVFRLHGVPRMHERPQAELFRALRELGYQLVTEQSNDKLPVLVHGQPPSPRVGVSTRSCSVSMESSSQFASALLLCARTGGWTVNVQGENSEESPYVSMTRELIDAFPRQGGEFLVEPDASSGSYFVAAEALVPPAQQMEPSDQSGNLAAERCSRPLFLKAWPSRGWQIDERFPEVIQAHPVLRAGLERTRKVPAPQPVTYGTDTNLTNPGISRARDLGDSIMTAIVLAPFSLAPVRFTDLGRLRVQECERVAALRTELCKCGVEVLEQGDTLTILPGTPHAAEIETYNDHRMAMCFAILGLKVAGIKLNNPACVKKTFPNFFQKLSAPPPTGLGAIIRDAVTGRRLAVEECFAD